MFFHMFSGGKSTLQLPYPGFTLPLDFVVFKRPDPSEAKDPSCWERPKLPPCHGASEVHIFPKKKELFWVFVQPCKTGRKNGSANIKRYQIASKCIKTKKVIKMYQWRMNFLPFFSCSYLVSFSVKGHMNPSTFLSTPEFVSSKEWKRSIIPSNSCRIEGFSNPNQQNGKHIHKLHNINELHGITIISLKLFGPNLRPKTSICAWKIVFLSRCSSAKDRWT